MERCDKISDETQFKDFKNSYNLSNFYCLSPHQDNNPSGMTKDDVYLQDSWGFIGFRMIQIKIYECKNTTTEMNCGKQEEIDNFVNNSTLTYYTFDTYVQTSNYSYPISSGIKEYFYYPNKNNYLAITDYIKHVEVDSDDGYIFNNNRVRTSYAHDHMYENIMTPNTRDYFVSLTFQLSNEKDGYQRKYYKLPDLAGQIGGIYKAVFVIFIILSHFYNENSMYENLFNHFFEVENNKESNEDYHKILGINDDNIDMKTIKN